MSNADDPDTVMRIADDAATVLRRRWSLTRDDRCLDGLLMAQEVRTISARLHEVECSLVERLELAERLKTLTSAVLALAGALSGESRDPRVFTRPSEQPQALDVRRPVVERF